MQNIKDKLEALKFMSQTHRELQERRIAREFKLFFTAFSAFILIDFAHMLNKFSPFLKSTTICFYIVSVLVIWYYFSQSYQSNKINQYIAEEAERVIILLLSEDQESNFSELLKSKHPSEYRWFIQVLFISMVALYSILILLFK